VAPRALLLCELADEPDVACFDMGGTSCDVCLIEGHRVPETAERTIAGRPVSLPALDIHTVGAGGGSIAWRDEGGALRVGPASAGAVPGPACYARGGTRATVTDANLLLGRLLDDQPLAGEVTLDRDAAQAAVHGLADELGLEPLACAEGIVRVAEAEMLAALRLITVERGIDPRGFALMPFGGAGPLHAARDELVAQALVALASRAARVRLRYELRYRGQSFELPVEHEEHSGAAGPGPGAAELRREFHRAHEARYGYRDEQADVELVNIRVSAWGAAPSLRPAGPSSSPPHTDTRPVTFAGRTLATSVLRGELAPGQRVQGPALCAMAEATLLVPPGWSGTADRHGTMHLERERGQDRGDARPD